MAALLGGASWLAFAVAASAQDNDELPLVRVAAPGGSAGPLVLLLSGDGDWAAFVRGLAERLAADGSPVLGLKARSYFSTPRTPAAAAAELEQVVTAELARTGRTELVVIGYSRGADMAAFVVNRWPTELRSRVRAIAFVGLSERASFEFHFNDLFLDVERPTDIPTRPEVAKLTGIPLLCVQGEDEKNSFCERPVAGMRALTHEGGHRVTSDAGVVDLLVAELGLEH